MCYGSSFHYRCGHLTARFAERCDNRCRLPESDPFPLDLDCEQCIFDMTTEQWVDSLVGFVVSKPEHLEVYLRMMNKDPSLRTDPDELCLSSFLDAVFSRIALAAQNAMEQRHIDGFEMTSVRRDQKRHKFPRPLEFRRLGL